MAKVIYEKRGEIAYITLNRPEKRNAIDREMDHLLFDAWTAFRAATMGDPEIVRRKNEFLGRRDDDRTTALR